MAKTDDELLKELLAWADNVKKEDLQVMHATTPVTSVPSSSELSGLEDHIGAFYDTVNVTKILGGVPEETVHGLRNKHSIIVAKTVEGQWVYPVYQFVDGDVDPRLGPVIKTFESSPPWSVALWFVTPNPDLSDITPLDWLRNNQSQDQVIKSAQRTRNEWQ